MSLGNNIRVFFLLQRKLWITVAHNITMIKMSRTITWLNVSLPDWHCLLASSFSTRYLPCHPTPPLLFACFSIIHFIGTFFLSALVFNIRMLKRPLGKWSNISNFDTMIQPHWYTAPMLYEKATISSPSSSLSWNTSADGRAHNMEQRLVVVFVMSTMGQVSFTLIAINALPFRHPNKAKNITTILRTK